MGAGSELSPHRVLEGVHGVRLMPHSPFRAEKVFHGDFGVSCTSSGVSAANQSLIIQRLWQQRPSCLRPIRCCLQGDRHLAETIANVVTSLPFIVLGLQAPRKNLNSKLYANSLIGVGIASSLYHSSRGQLRKYLRWADYTMIATTTVCLSRALRNENPKMLMAASAFFLPIQPLMVSAVHTGMMEHLLGGHQRNRSSDRHITCTPCHLYWEGPISSPTIASLGLLTFMLHGILLLPSVLVRVISFLNDVAVPLVAIYLF